MDSEFPLFGLSHVVALTLVAAASILLTLLARRCSRRSAGIRSALAALLIVTLVTTVLLQLRQGVYPPHGLPLHLSDAAVVLAVIALLGPRPWSLTLAYYWGLTGGIVALVTPDLHVPLLSVSALQFFLAHGTVVAAVAVLVWGEGRKPPRGSHWRAFAVGVFDWAFETNYLYLRHKPQQSTPLDCLGPWPVYIVSADLLACALFWLLHLALGRGGGRTAAKQNNVTP